MNALSPKHPSTVDHTLLARVAKGDQEAFERLYAQTSSLLYALVLRIVGKPADAADLLQEVYLEAWRKASNYDTARGAPMAWLVTLARSRAIDWVRALAARGKRADPIDGADRKSTRLNSSHSQISYAVFCLKKKKKK